MKSKDLTRSALLIMIFTMVSKLLGFVREMLIASKFGSGFETDTFFIASSGVSLIGIFMTEAISTTFIPVISEIERLEGNTGRIKHTNNVLNTTILVSTILSLVAIFFAPLLVLMLGSGFSGEQFKLAVLLTRIGLPAIIFSAVKGIFSGYLQSSGRFVSTSLLGLPSNLVYIGFLLFFSALFGIKGLAITLVIAAFSQVLIQLPELKSAGFKYQLIFNLNDPYLKKIVKLSFPILVGMIINDIGFVIDKNLASNLVEGSVSVLNYASKLNDFISTVFIVAITTVVFPMLSKSASKYDLDELKDTMRYGANIIFLISVPATVGLIVLARPIVEIAFQRGAFTANDTIMTSQALICYAVGLVATAFRQLVFRVYYSLKDTKTPMITGFISTTIDIVLNFVFVSFMAHAGLALSTSLGIIVSLIMLLSLLRRKIGSLGLKQYFFTFSKIGFSAIVMGVMTYGTYHMSVNIMSVGKLQNVIALGVSVVLSVIVYVVMCYLLKVSEIRDILDAVKKRMRMTTR